MCISHNPSAIKRLIFFAEADASFWNFVPFNYGAPLIFAARPEKLGFRLLIFGSIAPENPHFLDHLG